MQQEWHIAPELGRQVFKIGASEPCAPGVIAGDQRSGGVCGTAGHTPRDGDNFADREIHPADDTGTIAQQTCGPDREVAVVLGDQCELSLDIQIGVDHHVDLVIGPGRRAHFVMQPNSLIDRRQWMEAIVTDRSDAQVQVDLRGYANGDDAHANNLVRGSVRMVGDTKTSN